VKLLLDTHLLLWAANGSLPLEAEALVLDETNDLLFSAASIWEVAIKASLGRPDFRADPHLLRRGLIDAGYEELAITSGHAAAVSQLPPVHRDPFDRLLIAQATIEGVALLTSDRLLANYPGPIRVI
jgi:PIN domain nuclease of toxin-antitoxin system